MTKQLALFPLPRPLFDSRCLDCDVDTIELGEFYMLRKAVWREANPDGDGMLCVGCVEQRLGRQLASRDFTDAPINRVDHRRISGRLRSRMVRP